MPKDLVAAAHRLKMPALAITDRNNLYGAVHFYMQAQKAGIKPVLGMEVDLEDGSSLVLLARNMDGYRNLCHLSSALRLNADPEEFPPAGFGEEDEEITPWDPGVWGVPLFGFTAKPPKSPRSNGTRLALTTNANSKLKIQHSRLPLEVVFSGRHTRGLIALSGGSRGLLNRLLASSQGRTRRAAKVAGMLLSAFGEGNFFVELTACTGEERRLMPTLAALASDLGIPLVATNDVLYIESGDATVAAALASARPGARVRASTSGRLIEDEGIHHDPHAQRLTAPPTGRHFASTEEMAALFEEYPQALANARFIADQCDVELPLHKPLFPAVDLGRRGNETPFSRLWKLCFAGATRLYKPLHTGVISRLKHELEIIEKLGFSPYFLVVYDIALFARRKGIPTMARGSAANSLVAYVLGITQVDPLAHDLLFERFLNPSRAEFELPDIDIDLCWRRRDEVLHYVYERYGRDHVAIVGTHITFRLRSAWREMAKALGIHPDRISRVASRLPHLFTAEEILEESVPELEALSEGREVRVYGVEETLLPGLLSEDQKFRDSLERQAFELCKAIEGLPRHAGMHCAGVVITPGPITDLVPLQRAARDASMSITQYEKDAIEAMGLVKMDLLGSRALTTLVDAVQAAGLAKDARDVHDSLAAIPFDDAATYRMLAQGDTLGCFQLESPGMRGLLKWLRPRSMNDMAAAISLFRPGPMEGGFLEIFMRRHLGQEPVSYPHPAMEPILKSTYGIILYQEQFLRLAHTLGGLSLGDAEKLRKEIGKSRSMEERARLGANFVAGCIERGIDQMQAERVWEIISGYTGFGFCQAHAFSYALTAYRSAYMKAHHPAQYLAAQINNLGGYYGTGVYVEDARRLGLELLPPHANLSGAFCEAGRPPDTRQIRFGLQFVKGLSEKTIALVQSERRARGPFRHLLDLLSRVEMSPSEAASLVKVGACDDLGAYAEGQGTANSDTGELEPLSELPPLNRRQMLWLLPTIISYNKPKRPSTQHSTLNTQHSPKSLAPIQLALGDLMHDVGAPRILGGTTLRIDVPDMPDFSQAEKLRLEREVLGFTLTRNEMELYGDMVAARGIVPSHALGEYAGHKVTVAGVIAAGRRHLAKGGEWMLFVSLQDSGGLMEVVLFPEVYKEHATLIANNGCGPYSVTGTVQVAGKGRGVGVQLPVGVRPSDATVLKTHPVVIVEGVAVLA
jgi:DNA-directed DNA polymerase III PolC